MKRNKNGKALRNMVKAKRREKMKSEGYYDGRFGTRSEKSMKTYSRKTKHKGKDSDDQT